MKERTGFLAFFVLVIMMVSGCSSTQQGYQKAFDSQHSLTQNQSAFSQSPESIFKIVKQTFVQQGFTIESADVKSGIIKAIRNMEDKENSEISYNIHASADISEIAGAETNVALAASQQTILHRSSTTWWHLLWILPIIPTGTEYQTLVIKEGNITEPAFYTDFFNSLKIAVTKYDLVVKAAAAKAAEKAELEKIAAEKAAKLKAEADAKALAENAEAERIAAAKAAQLKAEAKAAADKIEAEKKAAADKAEAERIVAEKARAEQLTAEKMVAEKEAAAKEVARLADEKSAAAAKTVTKTKKK
jgi:hypothetical protein